MPEIELIQDNRFKIGLTGYEEIIQNVKVILSTLKGSVCLDRDFGIGNCIDEPVNQAVSDFEIEAVEMVEKYEPRVRVKYISWKKSEAGDGRLVPCIGLEVKDESA
jgi:phage baseplate assembly protein W